MQTDPRLLSQVRTLSAAAFAQRYSHPFLGVSIIDIDEDEDGASFQTLVNAIDDLDAGESTDVLFLAPVAKRSDANAFSFITIGRASNNDIVISRPIVSKSHALLQPGEAGYTISDMGSRNGTLLNGKSLVPRQPRPINDGDIILFAPGVTAEFLEPRSAYDWLRRLDRR